MSKLSLTRFLVSAIYFQKTTKSHLLSVLRFSGIVAKVSPTKPELPPSFCCVVVLYICVVVLLCCCVVAPCQLSLAIVGDVTMTVSHLLTSVTLSDCSRDLCQTENGRVGGGWVCGCVGA